VVRVSRTVGVPRSLVAITLLAVIGGCELFRDSNEPLEECVDYSTRLGSCLGAEVYDEAAATLVMPPPKDKGEREALRARCGEQRDRLRRICR
jgi:hypothetical protein